MQAKVMMKNHLLDYSLQTYHGFALNNEEITEFRPDISSLASRLAYLYLFNAKEYSMAAQKSGLSRQKQAAFSFGLGAFLFLNRIMADSSLVPSVLYPDFNEEARIVKLPGFGGGILANFSATVPFFKFFFCFRKPHTWNRFDI